MCFGSFPAHIFEHALLDVLKGHVDVTSHFGKAGNGGDKFIRPVSRVGVEKPNPEVTFDGGKGIEKVDQALSAGSGDLSAGTATFGPAIHAEVGGILGNQEKLFDSLRNKLFGFTTNRFDCPTPMFASHLRNDAEGAGMVATLGNLYIGKMFGCQTPAGSIEVGDVDGKMVGHEIFRGSAGGAGQDTADDGGNLL